MHKQAPTFTDLTIAAFAVSPTETRRWLADCVELVLPHNPDARLADIVTKARTAEGVDLTRIGFAAGVIANGERPGSPAQSVADAVQWACSRGVRNMAHALFHASCAVARAAPSWAEGETAKAELEGKVRALWAGRFAAHKTMAVA